MEISRDNAFPKNYLLKNPLVGSLVFWGFSLAFILLYRPLGTHAGRFFGYEMTMVLYGLFAALFMFGAIHLIHRMEFFSGTWTNIKELLAIMLVLFITGCGVYLAGFLLEEPSDRWNMPTFISSLTGTLLVGLIPFGFFTTLSVAQRRTREEIQNVQEPVNEQTLPSDEWIHIHSQLKKEELGFYLSQFIYATSDSNYVIFHLLQDDVLKKVMIRNSISNVEEQMADIPAVKRVHRAYLVNMHKVRQRKGNTLGYRLAMEGVAEEIPVARNRIREFDEAFGEVKS